MSDTQPKAAVDTQAREAIRKCLWHLSHASHGRMPLMDGPTAQAVYDSLTIPPSHPEPVPAKVVRCFRHKDAPKEGEVLMTVPVGLETALFHVSTGNYIEVPDASFHTAPPHYCRGCSECCRSAAPASAHPVESHTTTPAPSTSHKEGERVGSAASVIGPSVEDLQASVRLAASKSRPKPDVAREGAWLPEEMKSLMQEGSIGYEAFAFRDSLWRAECDRLRSANELAMQCAAAWHTEKASLRSEVTRLTGELERVTKQRNETSERLDGLLTQLGPDF